MYASINFKTKKALKDAVTAGNPVRVQPSAFAAAPQHGPAAVEGPWYPEPHRWYASVELTDGLITKVK